MNSKKLVKNLAVSFIVFTAFAYTYAADKPASSARTVGPLFSTPVSYQGKLYFVATTGVLFESDAELANPKMIFDGKKQSLGSIAIDQNTLYWGEGLHDDKKTVLHAYDLKEKKIIKEVTVDGHIERPPFIKGKTLIVGIGPGGIASYQLPELKLNWQLKKIGNQGLHVDSNIVWIRDWACFTSIYEFKGVVCVDPSNGKIVSKVELARNPKSEIAVWENKIIGFASDAALNEPKFSIPSDLFLVDVEAGKVILKKGFSGFNLFPPILLKDRAFITLSTGQMAVVSLPEGKLQVLGEFREPFINNAFLMNNHWCAISIAGRMICYEEVENAYHVIHDKKFFAPVIGKITIMGDRVYAPSRASYYSFKTI